VEKLKCEEVAVTARDDFFTLTLFPF